MVNPNIPCSQLSQQESEEMFRLTMQPVMENMKGQFVEDALGDYQSELGLTVAVWQVNLCKAHSLQMSVKLTKEVFLVPTRTTWGGFITNFLFSPATMSGFFSRMMLKTRFRSWGRDGTKSYANCSWHQPHSHHKILKNIQIFNTGKTSNGGWVQIPAMQRSDQSYICSGLQEQTAHNIRVII